MLVQFSGQRYPQCKGYFEATLSSAEGYSQETMWYAGDHVGLGIKTRVPTCKAYTPPL